MPAMNTHDSARTVHISRDTLVAAPVRITFQAVIEEIGAANETPDGTPFPMKLEAWPGGRWYRDLGDDAGHLWGFVQVIKPPALLEISGPLFMSYPALNHLQYRLAPEGAGTRLTITHRAWGLIPPEHLDGAESAWDHSFKLIARLAQRLLESTTR